MDTPNLKGFGYRELDLASDLLKAVAHARFAGDDIKQLFERDEVSLEMNPNSGDVFLVGSMDCDVYALDENGLVNLHMHCDTCEEEGFIDVVDGECKKCRNNN